jgi:hypothetical protein
LATKYVAEVYLHLLLQLLIIVVGKCGMQFLKYELLLMTAELGLLGD